MRLQHETDFDDPEQRFEWALEGITMNGMPVALPTPLKRELSKQLSLAGFIHVSQLEGLIAEEDLPGLQEIHYQPPIRGQQHSMNTFGEWKPVTEEIIPPVVPTVELMTDQEKAKMVAELKEGGYID